MVRLRPRASSLSLSLSTSPKTQPKPPQTTFWSPCFGRSGISCARPADRPPFFSSPSQSLPWGRLLYCPVLSARSWRKSPPSSTLRPFSAATTSPSPGLRHRSHLRRGPTEGRELEASSPPFTASSLAGLAIALASLVSCRSLLTSP